jgi:hypothetical protein
MHFEILVEDSSGEKLLQHLLPQLLGNSNTWRVHAYKGMGRVPKGLGVQADPAKRILLDRLPKLLRGYGKTPGIDGVVVLLDTDDRNCSSFLKELKQLVQSCHPAPPTLIRLAIEEIEAWYFGDSEALLRAYPRAKRDVLKGYVQDSVCGTWEMLADAVYVGGAAALKKAGWPLPGQVKHQWAESIGPYLALDRNRSPSFCKFRDGLQRLAKEA